METGKSSPEHLLSEGMQLDFQRKQARETVDLSGLDIDIIKVDDPSASITGNTSKKQNPPEQASGE